MGWDREIILKLLAKARDKVVSIADGHHFSPAEHREGAQIVQHLDQLSRFPVVVHALHIRRHIRQNLPHFLNLEQRIRSNQSIDGLGHEMSCKPSIDNVKRTKGSALSL